MVKSKRKLKHQPDPSSIPLNEKKALARLQFTKKSTKPAKLAKSAKKEAAAEKEEVDTGILEVEKVGVDEWLNSDEEKEAPKEDALGNPMQDSSSDSDEEDLELKSKKLETEEQRLQKEAELELQEQVELPELKEEEKFVLPTPEELELEAQLPDLKLIKNRILQIIQILKNLKRLGRKGVSRNQYVEQLKQDIATYYGYNLYLVKKLFNLFSINEIYEFFEANETSRPLTIRTNTLKSYRRDLAARLIQRGVNLDPLADWSTVGLQVFDYDVPIGATPEYLAGLYMIQAASSMLPVMSLNPQQNEFILDMCAAPGGKTTYIGALMKNTGCIVANDFNKSRTKALVANIHRMGLTNAIVTNYDGKEMSKITKDFDRVLLDAPCSGTGVISKDPSVKINKEKPDFDKLADLQRKLLLSAIDCTKTTTKKKGIIVYSTCSITIEENEHVVNYVLSKRPNVKLVDTGLKFGTKGFKRMGEKIYHDSLQLTRRYYPHTHNMDGFFIAKFEKISNKIEK